jgi:dienelactone hydrolase
MAASRPKGETPIRLPALAPAALALFATLALPAGAPAAQTVSLVELPAPLPGAFLSLPARAFGERPRGVVVVLPDAPGHDGRAAAYVALLLRHNVATLELGVDRGAADRADLAATLVVARQHLAADPRLAAAPVALLGFGEGAVAAMAWAGALPVVALYPRCASVEAMPVAETAAPRAPLLLLHPASDGTDAPGACARLVEAFGPGGFRHAYPDTTPGWDIVPVGSLAGPTLQPRDGGTFAGIGPAQRYRAVARPGVTHDAARRVAWFVTAAFDGRGPWAPPAGDP